MPFAQQLQEFPQDLKSNVVLELGSQTQEAHDYLLMKVLVLAPTGHSALEYRSRVCGRPPVRADSHFYVPGMPADFNSLGARLVAWLSEPKSPMIFEWDNT